MGNSDRQVVLVLVTFPDEAAAAAVARALLEERLVACVNLVPRVRSLYRWQGEIEDESEVLGVMKTSSARLAELSERVVALHPYDTPEVVALDPRFVEAGYAAWALAAVDPDGADGEPAP